MNISNTQLYERAALAIEADAIAPDIFTLISLENVFNRTGNWQTIRSTLRRLPLVQVLSILSNLSIELERGRQPFDAAIQYRVIEALNDGSRRVLGLLRRFRESPTRVVVHEQQLAVLAKMAIIHCNAETWPLDGKTLLLQTLLAFNSLCDTEITSKTKDPETRLLYQEVRNSLIDNDSPFTEATRFGSFVTWSRSEEAKASRHYIDIDHLFEEALSMTFLEFTSATFAFYSHFGGTNREHNGLAAHSAFLDPIDFTKTVRDQRVLRRWLALVTLPIDEARLRLAKTVPTTSIASLQPFMNTPIIRIADVLYCPAIRYLPNVAGFGLIFRLGDYLTRRQDIHGSNRLRGLYALFLEYHVAEQLNQATKNDHADIRREISFGASERSSDIAIFKNRTAVFIDVNSKRLNLENSVIALDKSAIDDDLNKIVASKVKKIGQRASDFIRGKLVYDGIDPAKITRIYGLVTSPQGLTRIVGIPRAFDRLLPEKPKDLAAWDYFDLSEIELLARIYDKRLNLAELIDAKQNSEFGKIRSLSTYLSFKDPLRLRSTITDLEILEDSWLKQIIETMRGWGLDE